MATLPMACRRMVLLTTSPTPPPPLFSSSPAPSSHAYARPSAPTPSARAAPAAALPLPSSGRRGLISGHQLCPWDRVLPRSHEHTDWSHRHPGVLTVTPANLQNVPASTKGHKAASEGRPGEAARQSFQLWRGQKAALSSERFSGSSFSQQTPDIKSGRFQFMATASTTQSSGLATSSETGGESSYKFVTFETKDGENAVGIVRGDALWSLHDALKLSNGKSLPEISDMASVINYWSELKDRLTLEGSGTSLSEVKLLAPIPRPTGAIMCIGKNYLDHVKEVDTWKTHPGITTPEAPKNPIVFTKAPQSVIGPGAAIEYPHGVSSAVDYEAELGVIIGKAGRKIKREDAMSYIFGYTIVNDVTARDVQKLHQQWFLGKSCDTFCPMGPGIVPASQIDGNDLHIQCWVNDELRQDGRTSQMIFGIPELIEVISAAITLQPGDIIATGTPSGVGSGFNPPRHLTPGDQVRISIEGIGELCNTVE